MEFTKAQVEQVEEKISGSGSRSNVNINDDPNNDVPSEWTEEEEKKIVYASPLPLPSRKKPNSDHSRRIDRRLLPILGAMYAISLVDRTNLGLAAVAGMNKDLKLTGDRYTIIIMLFFVMYIFFEIPSVRYLFSILQP